MIREFLKRLFEPRVWTQIGTMDLKRVADGKVVGCIIVTRDQYGNIKKTRIGGNNA
jgi:hypothetical protein